MNWLPRPTLQTIKQMLVDAEFAAKEPESVAAIAAIRQQVDRMQGAEWMSTPHKCPVCSGSGKVEIVHPISSTVPDIRTCHTCGGTGVVWEPKEGK